jgi:hypothetical protein
MAVKATRKRPNLGCYERIDSNSKKPAGMLRIDSNSKHSGSTAYEHHVVVSGDPNPPNLGAFWARIERRQFNSCAAIDRFST